MASRCRLCLGFSLGNPLTLWASVSLSTEWAVTPSPLTGLASVKVSSRALSSYTLHQGGVGKKGGLHFCFSASEFRLSAPGSGLCPEPLGDLMGLRAWPAPPGQVGCGAEPLCYSHALCSG